MERGHGFRALQKKGIWRLSAWRTFIVITLYALQAWVPTLLIRVHGMDIADAGRGYGSIALLCGSAGVLSGPVLAQYFTRKGHKDAGLRVATLAAAVLLPAIVFAGFTADTTLALVAIAVSSFLSPCRWRFLQPVCRQSPQTRCAA